MIASIVRSHICSVCHQPMASDESFLLQQHSGRSTAVHRHLCYPPPAPPVAQSLGVFHRAA
jgi:hypothetical protein